MQRVVSNPGEKMEVRVPRKEREYEVGENRNGRRSRIAGDNA